jgi:RNA polymerase sigma-70 factor (ECF subfamily)
MHAVRGALRAASNGNSHSQGPCMAASDIDLLQRIAARDRDAFADFYDRHCGRVLGLLLRMLRRQTEAEDVLQDAFLQVWSQAGRYRADLASPTVWLVLLARSRALDQLRRRRRDDAQRPPDAARTAATSADLGEVLEREEGVRLASRALAQLPEEQRGVIRLAYYGGLTHEQIAESQRLPLGTVKTRIRRGIMRLREILS